MVDFPPARIVKIVKIVGVREKHQPIEKQREKTRRTDAVEPLRRVLEPLRRMLEPVVRVKACGQRGESEKGLACE